ncbi:MAG: hypothetical protein IH588_05810 [Anaerolineales bacterium]|nr:hypothetical protein [Anaerolineales bacterium]
MNKRSREYRITQLVHNRKYLEGYLKSSEDDPDYLDNKLSIVLPFLEYFDKEKLDANKIQLDQILIYSRTLNRKKDETFRLALLDFFVYVTTVARISFETEKLDLSLKELQQELRDEKRDAQVLQVEDVIKIRNVLTAKEHYKLKFTFEMFYVYGITLDEIEQFGSDHYSKHESVFMFTSKSKRKRIRLDESITELIEVHPDLLEAKGRTTYSGYMQDIGSTVKLQDRDKIIWKDIDRTRKEYFPTCSRCKQKYPNSAEFWALIEFEEDTHKKHWIYCKDCADEMRETV